MTHKLLRLEGDTKQELEKAIKKELDGALFVVRGLSVLKGLNSWEAWMIIDDKSDYIAGFE
jgi:hypothetical protein